MLTMAAKPLLSIYIAVDIMLRPMRTLTRCTTLSTACPPAPTATLKGMAKCSSPPAWAPSWIVRASLLAERLLSASPVTLQVPAQAPVER